MANVYTHLQFQIVSLNPNPGYCSWQQPGSTGGRRLVKWCRTQYLDTEGGSHNHWELARQKSNKQTLLHLTEQSVELLWRSFLHTHTVTFMQCYCFSFMFIVQTKPRTANRTVIVFALSNLFRTLGIV